MDPWKMHRGYYTDAAAAVRTSSYHEGWAADLEGHPLVVHALLQIDAAERVIASVATDLNCKYHDGEGE